MVHSIWDPKDTLAVSEQDYISVCNDTSLKIVGIDDEHIPMGLEIEQRSYAWSYSHAEDFVIFDYFIKNVIAEITHIHFQN